MDNTSSKKAYVKSPLPEFLTDWAGQMNIELIQSYQQQTYELVFDDGILQLNWLGDENFSPLFAQPPQPRRIKSTNLLYKAIGKNTHVVHDMTAGLGLDSMTLAAMGKTVYCSERCAPIALLCFDGLRRCPAKIRDNITIACVDSLHWLESTDADFDTIYIDTMFVHKKKSAKSAKAMQILRVLAGDDGDADLLLNKSINSGAKRVVIKHSDTGEVIKEKPTVQYHGRTVRFDIYLPT